ncbi:MAG TPA: adenosine kinase, partial [Rhodospirillaceae bacterium]|nr:adenosine kinase [Rhodospirillaceae bacterium]
MKYDLVSIGNAPVDAIVKVDTSFLEKFGMEEGALTVINAETRDEMLEALKDQKIDFISGGGSANVVSVLCSAGGKGAFQGRVGDDDNGELFIQSLK